MKLPTWTSSSGNRKGAIFAIDSAVAVTLAIIVMAAASYFASYSEGDPMTKIQVYKTGYDIVASMDYLGYFDRFSSTEMTNFTNETLPSNIRMQLRLTVYNASGSELIVGPLTISTNNSVMYGDRITTVRNEPAVARFAVWQ